MNVMKYHKQTELVKEKEHYKLLEERLKNMTEEERKVYEEERSKRLKMAADLLSIAAYFGSDYSQGGF